ncbi:zinc finger protein 414 isoform X2 [Denticeps clupeoides]|uniref:zinc finger protein 414 isoform X2 n=1 Tax=Denticeps clupeoides TaxID=299321 RepID=UPI0010A32766|nr:zinc finger protein 414 isoform X2 [Denticeps clupeoides]
MRPSSTCRSCFDCFMRHCPVQSSVCRIIVPVSVQVISTETMDYKQDPTLQQAGSHHEGPSLPCTFFSCKRTFTDAESLSSHLRDHQASTQSLPGKLFLCSSTGCNGQFTSMQQLMDHMRHHYKPNYFFLCESCRAKLRSYRTLLKHLQTCAKVAKTKAGRGVVQTPVPDAAEPYIAPPETTLEQMESEPEPTFAFPLATASLDSSIPHEHSSDLQAIDPAGLGRALSDASQSSPQLSAAVPPVTSPAELRSSRDTPIGSLPGPHGSNAVWRKNQDAPGPIMHRRNSSPASQTISRGEVQGSPSTAASCGNTPGDATAACNVATILPAARR